MFHFTPATTHWKILNINSPSGPWPSPRVCGGPCWPLLHFLHPTHIWGQNPHPSAPQPELSGWERLPVVSSVVRPSPTHPISSVRPQGWLYEVKAVGSARLNKHIFDSSIEMVVDCNNVVLINCDKLGIVFIGNYKYSPFNTCTINFNSM